MKISELITALQQLPPDGIVSIENGDEDLVPILAASVISYKDDERGEQVYAISSSTKDMFADDFAEEEGVTFHHNDS